MFSRCDIDNKSNVPLEAEVIPVQHSAAEANASDESDGVAKHEDEQIGIFQILDKLEEAVDALLNTSSSLPHSQLEVKTKQIKPHHCTQCSKSFAQESKLKIHMTVHTGEKPFSCSSCKKSFAYQSTLHRHFRVHIGEKPFSCSQCTKSFAFKTDLEKHLRIHTGEKPYSCSQCSKSFANSSVLKVHLRKHSGEKPYSCSQCSKSFAHSSVLKVPYI
jgi:uncharacterized Zn-finger protein